MQLSLKLQDAVFNHAAGRTILYVNARVIRRSLPRSQVVDGETDSNMEGSCEYTE